MCKYLLLLLSFLLILSDCFAEDILFDVAGMSKTFNENVYIAENAELNLTELFIAGSLTVENHGNLSAGILNVCDRCDVWLENYNAINFDNVVLNIESHIFQKVSNVDNMKPISVSSEYTVVVNGDNGLSLSDVVDVASGTGHVVLENTTLRIDSVPANISKSIEIKEDVKFIVNKDSDIYNVTLLDNVTGGATARFILNNDDVMYVTVGKIADGKLFVEHIRETDYSIILGDNTGLFLNSLRTDGKNDKLMYALDSAVDKDSLYGLMDKSVLFNPDVLIKPLQVINTINMMSIDDGISRYVGADAFGVITNDFYLFGADMTLAGVVNDKFNVSLGAQIANMKYLSDFNSFSGVLYGMNLHAKYLFNNMFMRMYSGLSFAQFDIEKVMYNDKIISEPNSLFGYTVFDMGYNLYFDSFSVVPVAGIGMRFYDLSGIKYSDYVGRIGGGIEYKYTVSNLEYLYALSVIADTDLSWDVSGKVGFLSPIDMVGGHIELSIINTNDTISYKASVNAKILF